jgi:hypothetical protein
MLIPFPFFSTTKSPYLCTWVAQQLITGQFQILLKTIIMNCNFTLRSLFFLAGLMIAFNTVFSQNNIPSHNNSYPVRFGERPPIDLDNLSSDTYEPGIIKIKLSPNAENILPAEGLPASGKGVLTTGHPDFDGLNRAFGATSYTPLFGSLYQTGSRSSQFTDRHRAWGLHLWFEVAIGRDADVAAAVKQFAALDEIEFAEPEYKKQLVIALKRPTAGGPSSVNKTEKYYRSSIFYPRPIKLFNQKDFSLTGRTV